MVEVSSSKKKRATAQNKGLTAQDKKTLQCILGCCTHDITSRTCVYWNKVVDSDDPALTQMKLIAELFRKNK